MLRRGAHYGFVGAVSSSPTYNVMFSKLVKYSDFEYIVINKNIKLFST